jgi:O-antigen ligase/polysaccharide polymerase Wzy-like membrane protein
MKTSVLDRLPLDKMARFLWGAALFCLPVTSFRYYPLLGEGTFVRPLALYPVALLIFVLLIQFLRGKSSVPRAGMLVPLAAFVLFTITASSFGAWLDPLPMRGQEYFGRVIRAWATVAIGLSFFVSALWMNRSEDDVRFSVRWILVGFVMDVLWSGVQMLALYTPLLAKETVTHWQLVFSVRELTIADRVSGMAYEPAWLAGQIATIYLPWLFAALLTRVRVTRFQWLEIVLLGFSGLLLLTTLSRGGLLTSGVALALTFLLAGRAELRAAWNWFVSGSKNGGGAILRTSMIVVTVGALAGAAFFLSRNDYVARLFNSDASSVEEFIVENYAGARGAYMAGALGAYKESPFFGVGLGASGFYIYDNLPDWAMTFVPEIARQLAPTSHLYPNPKNMYARLLAETGLIGFAFFLFYLFSLLGDVLRALHGSTTFSRYLGIAALFSWIAILIYNATQDSFATPNIWINFGILAGMSAMMVKDKDIALTPASTTLHSAQREEQKQESS